VNFNDLFPANSGQKAETKDTKGPLYIQIRCWW